MVLGRLQEGNEESSAASHGRFGLQVHFSFESSLLDVKLDQEAGLFIK